MIPGVRVLAQLQTRHCVARIAIRASGPASALGNRALATASAPRRRTTDGVGLRSRSGVASISQSASALFTGKSVSPPSPVPTDPVTQLRRCDELRRRTGATNRAAEKVRIIAEYPDLRELLEYIYQPKLRFGLRPANLQQYLSTRQDQGQGSQPVPGTLLEMYRQLAARGMNNQAREAVACFLIAHGIWRGEAQEASASRAAEALGNDAKTPFETFCRLLLRTLNSGWSASTLKSVPWEGTAPPAVSQGGHATSLAKPRTSAPRLDTFQVALSRPISPPFPQLFKTKVPTSWSASRKLDGVRCITYIDVWVPANGGALSVESIHFLSRAGNDFTSLNKLRGQLERVAAFPRLREWLLHDPVVIASASNKPRSEGEGVMKRLVLDGEMCVLRQSGDDFVEDFPATVSQVKRKNIDVEHPAYFLLDIISWAEFSAGAGSLQDLALKGPSVHSASFMARHRQAEALCAFLGEHPGGGVWLVPQIPINHLRDVEPMVRKASAEGWEGLVFRADTAYKGNRSSDLYKYKHWLDAEYTVQSLDTSIQRLSIDGVYGEHEACSNVWIEHNGHPVSIGTGFTTEQRLRYARDPSAIVGKQITVEYFEESASVASGREGVPSLRFPRVKHVWEEGKRSV